MNMVSWYIVFFIIHTQTVSYFVCSIDFLTSMLIVTVTGCCCDMYRLSVSWTKFWSWVNKATGCINNVPFPLGVGVFSLSLLHTIMYWISTVKLQRITSRVELNWIIIIIIISGKWFLTNSNVSKFVEGTVLLCVCVCVHARACLFVCVCVHRMCLLSTVMICTSMAQCNLSVSFIYILPDPLYGFN